MKDSRFLSISCLVILLSCLIIPAITDKLSIPEDVENIEVSKNADGLENETASSTDTSAANSDSVNSESDRHSLDSTSDPTDSQVSEDESSKNETTATNSTVKPIRVNCVPVFRDESNKTGKIVVLNHTSLGDYVVLSALPFSSGPTPSAVGQKRSNGNETNALNSTDATNTTSNETQASEKSDDSSNATLVELFNLLISNDSQKLEAGECSVVIFYLSTCPHSVAASAHFHAIARLYPQLNVLAIDAYDVYGATIRFGVVGVPSLYFFHKARLVSKFAKFEPRVDNLGEYFKTLANLDPIDDLEVLEQDFEGPLPLKVEQTTNWVYYLAVLFIVLVAAHKFYLSEACQSIVAKLRENWTARQFQHEHLD